MGYKIKKENNVIEFYDNNGSLAVIGYICDRCGCEVMYKIRNKCPTCLGLFSDVKEDNHEIVYTEYFKQVTKEKMKRKLYGI